MCDHWANPLGCWHFSLSGSNSSPPCNAFAKDRRRFTAVFGCYELDAEPPPAIAAFRQSPNTSRRKAVVKSLHLDATAELFQAAKDLLGNPMLGWSVVITRTAKTDSRVVPLKDHEPLTFFSGCHGVSKVQALLASSIVFLVR